MTTEKSRRSICILSVLVSLLAASCEKPAPGQDSARPTGNYVLPLMETTDIHGHIVDLDSDGTVHYKLAYIADKADDIRGHDDQCQKDRLLLLDGGDLYQGASVSNLLSGWPIYVAADRMGYDAVALGNHEFDWGIGNTVDADATLPDYDWNGQHFENKVPVVCANLYQDGQRVPFTCDYVIVEKTATGPGGATVPVKVGIVGFAVNYAGSIITTQFIDKGLSIREDYSIANDIAAELEANQGCDLTVLLIHGQARNAADRLGAHSAFDLVLGGHSHGTIDGKTDWGLPYLQGGCYCGYYACANLNFTVDAAGEVAFSGVTDWSVPNVDSRVDTRRYPGHNAYNLSEEIVAVSDAALAATAEQQNDVIGYITVGATTFYIDGSGERSAVMSNWMCDLLRRISEADVAFVNSGGIRTYFALEGQSRRDITVANVYEMFPFNNQVYRYRLTYAELLKVFEYSLTSGGGSLFSRVTGIDCCFTGGTVRALVKDGAEIYRDGSWAAGWASREVILAVCSYVATTERTDYATGLGNPLIPWNSTARLLDNTLIDNENAVRVLREEAAASGGHLYIDTAPHFIAW